MQARNGCATARKHPGQHTRTQSQIAYFTEVAVKFGTQEAIFQYGTYLDDLLSTRQPFFSVGAVIFQLGAFASDRQYICISRVGLSDVEVRLRWTGRSLAVSLPTAGSS